MPEITLSGLVKRYGETTAANGLSLTIHDGEYLCILGPTGSGKTTCLRMICGLTTPDEGTVSYDGEDMTEVSTSDRHAAMLSQVYSLFPPLTVYENVMFAPKINQWSESDSKQIVKSMITLVHMENKISNYPHELSGGQQQRTALARALASNSKILLLDEPLRALDARLRLELRKELKSMAKEMKLTSVHVTHDQDEALEMADRIAIIRNGKIIQVGTPMDVFSNPETLFIANFVGRSNNFEGKVGKTYDSYTEFVLENGTILKARKSEISEDTFGVLAIKIGSTRAIAVKDSTELDQNVAEWFMKGKVERILYEGVTITIEVDIDGVGRVSSKLPNRKFDDYQVGDEVIVDWLPERAIIFAISSEDIENELRLD